MNDLKQNDRDDYQSYLEEVRSEQRDKAAAHSDRYKYY